MGKRVMVEGSSGTIADKHLTTLLTEKWHDFMSPKLPDVPQNKHLRDVAAMILESQAGHLRHLTESTRMSNVGYYTKFIFPVLTNLFPNLITPDILSVQPLTASTGAIFYLDYLYGSNKGGVRNGDNFPMAFDEHFTSEFIDGEILATGDGTNYGGGGSPLTSSLAWNPVQKPSSDRGITVIIKELDATTGSTVQEGRFLASGAFDSTTALSAGTLNYSNGALTAVRFTTTPINGNQLKCYYTYDGELNQKQPTMKLDVKKAMVEVENFRTKLLWSVEAEEDLRSQHGLNLESELVSAASREMALEIDRRNLNRLFAASTSTAATFDRIPPAGIAEIEHLRSIITSFSKVSNGIHQKTLRGPANWAVVSTDIQSLLDQLTTHGDYRPIFTSGSQFGAPLDMPRPLNNKGQFGIYKAGVLNNKWMIYVDPFFQNDFAMLGLKGDSYLEAGAVWAPYLPLALTNTFEDPSDFGHRKGLRSRSAFKILRKEFYGQVRFLNL